MVTSSVSDFFRLRLVLVGTLLLFTTCIFAQSFNFELAGAVNADTGSVVLEYVGDSSFYRYQASGEYYIHRGKFSIAGRLEYPYAYRILVKVDGKVRYVSDLVFVDTGRQFVNINLDSSWGTPKIDNATSYEYQTQFAEFMKPVEMRRLIYYQRRDSMRERFGGKLSQEMLHFLELERGQLRRFYLSHIHNYLKFHQYSFVALWLAVDQLQGGYDPLFDSIIHATNERLTATYTGGALCRSVKEAGTLREGMKFPNIELTDTSGVAHSLLEFQGERYTLVDFWFSGCNPCISQFPDFKELLIYFPFLSIVGLSTDRFKDVQKWKNVIKTRQLPWAQLIDMDGKIASRLLVKTFPTNFLLDKNGVIVRRNVAISELRKLLSQ